jgi:HEAT repeat protein
MQTTISYRRPLFLTLAALFLCPQMLFAGDRPPAPVAGYILRAPKPENLVTLVGALRGSGCSPKHSEVGDAIVGLGAHSVPSLVDRLEGSDKWWIQLEAIHLLGLIGPEATKALPALDKFVSEKHHLLPAKYSLVTVAAIRQDVDFLTEKVVTRTSGASDFAIELLGRLGPKARAALPALKKHIADHPLSNTRSTAETAIKAITRPARP